MSEVFPRLSDAIEWIVPRWANQRAVPARLHTRDQEGTGLTRDRKGCTCLSCTDGGSDGALGSHAHTNAFAAALDGKPDTTEEMGGPTDCYHPLLRGTQRARECPECFGMGVKEHSTTRYIYPMALALEKLRLAKNSTPRQQHPYALVRVLAGRGWDPRKSAEVLGIPWDRAEALFLMAIRKLHSRYVEGPVATTVSSKWLELSQSQQNAIIAGETAA